MIVNFDRKVRIERPVAAKTGKGSSRPTWQLLTEVWAERRDELPSRSEAARDGLKQSANRTRYRIRFRSDVDATMRIVEGEVTYQIIGGPAEIGRKEYLELYCEKYTADGTV